jgi:ComF family protein
VPTLAAAHEPPRWRLPSQCEVCRAWGDSRLCTDCIGRFGARVPRCRQCALPLTGAVVCGACLRQAPAFARAVTAADYAFPWDRLIVDFKFNGHIELASALAARLTAAVHEAGSAQEVDRVVPVPLSPARQAERGFNQAWEIARRTARDLGLAADAQTLVRPLETAHQADLPREQRAVNLRGAFMVEPRARAGLQGQRVALVDDVLTTGATAREATAALLRGGAAAVQVWTVARTA